MTEEVTDRHEIDPLMCPNCGHRHTGPVFAGICIGCACGLVPPFDAWIAEYGGTA